MEHSLGVSVRRFHRSLSRVMFDRLSHPGRWMPIAVLRGHEQVRQDRGAAVGRATRAGLCTSARAGAIGAFLVATLFLAATPASAATFNALNIISYETFRGSSSMSAADIQAFLDAQSGPMKSLRIADHSGVRKSASQIIWDASTYWSINPKVVLSTLQKEQSLLSVSNSKNAARLKKAMGCGVYPGSTNTYPGFGNQVWNGTRKLSTYEVTYGWKPGKSIAVTSAGKSKTIVPVNASTFALYTYTPYYPQKLFWDVYVRYFEDPQTPPRMRPVYRLFNKKTHAYFYTAQEAQRYRLVTRSPATYSFQGAAFTVDASSTVDEDTFYRLYNTKAHTYYFTASLATANKMLKTHRGLWRVDAKVASVSSESSSGPPVYLLVNKSTSAAFFTSSRSTRAQLAHGSKPAFYDKGIAFYTGRSKETSTPVGPSTH